MEETRLYDTSAVIELIVNRRVSVIPGLVSIYTILEYPPSLKKVKEVLYPKKEDYLLALKWQIMLRKIGKRLPAVDLIIAAMGYNNNYTIVTLDEHFNTIKEVQGDIKIEFKL